MRNKLVFNVFYFHATIISGLLKIVKFWHLLNVNGFTKAWRHKHFSVCIPSPLIVLFSCNNHILDSFNTVPMLDQNSVKFIMVIYLMLWVDYICWMTYVCRLHLLSQVSHLLCVDYFYSMSSAACKLHQRRSAVCRLYLQYDIYVVCNNKKLY